MGNGNGNGNHKLAEAISVARQECDEAIRIATKRAGTRHAGREDRALLDLLMKAADSLRNAHAVVVGRKP